MDFFFLRQNDRVKAVKYTPLYGLHLTATLNQLRIQDQSGLQYVRPAPCSTCFRGNAFHIFIGITVVLLFSFPKKKKKTPS